MKKLPKCLYLRNGSYYYVTPEGDGRKWTNLGKDKNAAVSAANELNTKRRDERAALLRRMRKVYDDLRDTVLGRDEYKCVYCGATEDLVLDHFIPYERGGSTTPCNLVTACFPCNTAKRGEDPKRFLVELDSLRKHLVASILAELGRG